MLVSGFPQAIAIIFPFCLSMRYFCHVISTPISHTETSLFPLHPVVYLFLFFLSQLVGRIFFHYFELPVLFLLISGRISVTNCNVDSASSWNIPFWIFTSAEGFPLAGNFSLQFSWIPRWTLRFLRISYTFWDYLLSGFMRTSYDFCIPGLMLNYVVFFHFLWVVYCGYTWPRDC